MDEKRTASVLISIRPTWVDKILNGEKVLELRKRAPKIKVPFRMYIYMTKPKSRDGWECAVCTENGMYYGGGKVVAECVCDRVIPVELPEIMKKYPQADSIYPESGLKVGDIVEYLGKRFLGYFLHMTEIRVYEEAEAFEIQNPPQSWRYYDGEKERKGV